ncbi:hypothetical protein [Vreelandella titanicae]|uniref:hypothetical protein n=1 Tax=Vreelandella titanicae TaxID=664683 RepID=UPI0016809192|nr:hypothetical protein [Halomonas titanicae]QNU63293.1 hypothetical protein HZS52_02675 [Halomonas titanicae]
MSQPADVITVMPSLEADDAYDALTMAVEHARSTLRMAEMTIGDANSDGRLLIAPRIVATTLHGVETHLAAIEALAFYLHGQALAHEGSLQPGG